MHGTALCCVVRCLRPAQAVLVSQNPPPETWDIGLPRCAARCCALPSLRSGYAGFAKSSSGFCWVYISRDTRGCAVRSNFVLISSPATKKALRWCVGPFLKVERVMRFELTTFSLATRCSTTELHPHRVCCFAPDARSGRAICLHSDGLLTSDFS